MDRRNINVTFLMVPWESVYNTILRRLFLTMLDVVAYLFHLKMKYHNDAGQRIPIQFDMSRAHHTYDVMLKNSLEYVIIHGEKKKSITECPT